MFIFGNHSTQEITQPIDFIDILLNLRIVLKPN